ncbi:HD-GYP domain-containing protein [Vibrio sp.]|uniref:HD-GYP domain-containing protein n=1 Tax=Vibrio sp. TaxID=678 RepID=UPI003D130485
MENNDLHDFFAIAGTLNHQLSHIHQRIITHDPMITRLSFALYDAEHDELKTYAGSTLNGLELAHYSCVLNDLPSLRQCIESGEVRYINDLPHELNSTHPHNRWLIAQGFQSSLALPVYHAQTFIGFIFLNSCEKNAFNPEKYTTLKPFIDIIRFVVSSEYDLVHSLITAATEINEKSVEHWQESRAHKERISRFARVIALEVASIYQLDDELIEHISQFSKCHDIGKLSVPSQLLNKPSALGHDERVLLNQHVEKGIEIINQIIDEIGSPEHPSVSILKEIVAYHHEFLDGSGYPYGLTEESIPISARIIAVANIFDALTNHRPYKQAWSIPFALLELEKMVNAGKLDKHCVNALRYHQDYIKRVIEAYPEVDPQDR